MFFIIFTHCGFARVLIRFFFSCCCWLDDHCILYRYPVNHCTIICCGWLYRFINISAVVHASELSLYEYSVDGGGQIKHSIRRREMLEDDNNGHTELARSCCRTFDANIIVINEMELAITPSVAAFQSQSNAHPQCGKHIIIAIGRHFGDSSMSLMDDWSRGRKSE